MQHLIFYPCRVKVLFLLGLRRSHWPQCLWQHGNIHHDSVPLATGQHTSRFSACGNRATHITPQCLWQQGNMSYISPQCLWQQSNIHHESVPVATGQYTSVLIVPVATAQHSSRLSSCGNSVTCVCLWQQPYIQHASVPVVTAQHTSRWSWYAMLFTLRWLKRHGAALCRTASLLPQ